MLFEIILVFILFKKKNTPTFPKFGLYKTLSSTVLNIDNNKKCFLYNVHIRMISEGSYDAESLY